MVPSTTSGRATLAVDLDNVLFPFTAEMSRYHNTVYGTSFAFTDYTNYNFWLLWEVALPEAVRRIQEFLLHDDTLLIPPVPGACEAVCHLRATYDLIIVTARAHDIEEATRRWVMRHFPDCFRDILFSNAFALQGTPIPKSALCHDHGAHLLIDDHVDNIEECRRADLQVLLFGEYPWNQADDLHHTVVRALDWKAVCRLLLLNAP